MNLCVQIFTRAIARSLALSLLLARSLARSRARSLFLSPGALFYAAPTLTQSGNTNKKLARWVTKQRKAHADGLLSPDCVRRLSSIGEIGGGRKGKGYRGRECMHARMHARTHACMHGAHLSAQARAHPRMRTLADPPSHMSTRPSPLLPAQPTNTCRVPLE